MSTSDSSHSDSSEKSGPESNGSTGQTETETRTTDQAETEQLTTEEEKVIRMRRGLAEGDDHELEFAEGPDEATADKLAQLEAFLVDAFEDREAGDRYLDDAEYGEVEVAESDADSDAKQRIIDELSDD